MPIDPVGPPKTYNARLPPDAAQSARHPAPEAEGKPAAQTGLSAEETVELSAASRSLVEQAGESGEAPPHGTISAERLREVAQRLKSNFYERPEVRDHIACGLTKHLGAQPTE
jgi:hypothetical protein